MQLAKIIFVLMLWLIIIKDTIAQDIGDHPSTWPEPTIELLKTGFYTKEKMHEYWKWKRTTLPDLYLEFDDVNIKLTKSEWGNNNYAYGFVFKDLAIEFVVDNRPKEKHIAYIQNLDSSYLDTLNLKNYHWLSTFLKDRTDRIDKNCDEIESLYKDIYIVITDSKSQSAKIFKSNYCECLCHDDEVVK